MLHRNYKETSRGLILKMIKLNPLNGQKAFDQYLHGIGFENDLLASNLSSANACLACTEKVHISPDLDLFDKYLDELQCSAKKNPRLQSMFEGVTLKVILPQIIEEDPGLYFKETVLESGQRLKEKGKVDFEIKYGFDVPIVYRLTPTPKSGHQELLEKLLHKILPGWFIPSTIECNLVDLIGLIAQMPSNVSLLGFNDGWPVVLQNMKLFRILCADRAFWFTGINSETSGVGFCIEADSVGNLVLYRRPYATIKDNDVHGLLIT